ncbi:YfhO family protein [Chloroflexota bacterium]
MTPADKKKRRRSLAVDGVVVLLLLALCLLFFWQILTPDELDRRWLAKGDFTDQFYAFRHFQSQELWSGRLPLWNPYTLSGAPFMADIQAAVYYPIGLLIILLFGQGGLPLIAVEIEVILHFFLASLFVYLLVKTLTGSRLAGLVSGIVYAYGTYLTSYPKVQMAILEGQTWVPLSLLAIHLAAKAEERGWRGRSISWLAVAGLALGLSALAGHGQTFLLASYLVMAYLLFAFFPMWRAAERNRKWGMLAQVAIVPAVALGLGAAQLIPSLEYMQLSTRIELSYNQAGEGFLFSDLLALVLPGTRLVYIGVMPLILVLLAIALKGKKRDTVFWGIVAATALLLSLGRRSFVFTFFYVLAPGFNLFQGQERAMQVFSLATAILAGYGAAVLDQTMNRVTKHRYATFFRVLLWANVGAVILAFLALWGAQNLAQTESGQVNGLLERSVFLVVLLGLSTIILYLRLGHKLRGWRLGLLLIPLIVFDLFTLNYGVDFQKARARDRFETTPAIRFVQDQAGQFRVWDEYLLPGNSGTVWGLEMTSGISPLHLQRYDDLLAGLPDHKARLLLNAQYAFSRQHELLDGELVEDFTDAEKDIYFHRIKEPGAAACMVYSAQVESDDERVLELMAVDAFEPCQTVFLSEHPGITPAGAGQGTVRAVERLSNRLQYEVESDSDGILLLSEIYYPGWRATVDGQRTDILRANTALRAIPVQAGGHLVALTFRPWTASAGLIVAALTVALVLIGVLWLRKRDP